MKDKIFGVLQRVGRSFMLPIALLPVAGLLLGIGSSFTNATMLETYRLTEVIYPGGVLYTVLDIMSRCGSVVFDNLPLLFAMGVAIGMARAEKEVAALSGAIAYLVMNTAISVLIRAAGGAEAMADNATASTLGITTLQMGVFGGILVGLGVAALHNRFYNIRLPRVLSFFGGTRFVPIISTAVYLAVGVVMFYVWPFVQNGIAATSGIVLRSGYLGTWLYGIIERALIPFGLHHVFYMPFWQTALGGTAVIDGVTVQGAQNIFFAELAAGGDAAFSVSATRFMSGKFPFMIFGLAGAALAMYRCARPARRKIVGGLLLSAALTSALTGITEPLEFTFLFVAPAMYAVHCVLAGLSYMLMHLLGVGVGMTFSGGLIDLVLFGVLQGHDRTRWGWIIPVGIVYFLLYFGVFSLMIRKLDLKTPGREPDGEESRLYTRADMAGRAAAAPSADDDGVSARIVQALGGRDNLRDLDCCATRLRVTVADSARVDDALLRSTGASAVIRRGNGVQVVYGPQVAVIKSALAEHLARTEAPAAPAASAAVLYAHMSGTVVPLCEVADEAFSSGALGEGIAIEPDEGRLYAPADAQVEAVFDARHAISLRTHGGAELLLHVGIDTVRLGGAHFTAHVAAGQQVKAGELLLSFDREAIRAAGYATVTPLTVCNGERMTAVPMRTEGHVRVGDALLTLDDRALRGGIEA